MRPIEFRAWHNRKKKMLDDIDWQYLAISKDGILVYPGHTSLEEADKDIKLMQYTGLLDKNGVKIYEGDYTDSGLMICFVDGMFIPYYDWGNQERYEDVGCDWWSDCEIIGNQFENPNLPEEYDRE